MIDAKTLSTALWCINLVERHRAALSDGPDFSDLLIASSRIRRTLEKLHAHVDPVAADVTKVQSND